MLLIRSESLLGEYFRMPVANTRCQAAVDTAVLGGHATPWKGFHVPECLGTYVYSYLWTARAL